MPALPNILRTSAFRWIAAYLVLFPVAIASVVGYIFDKVDIPVAPLVLSLVLGGMMEQSFRQAMTISGADPGIFVGSGITVTLLVMSAIPLGLIGAVFGHIIMGMELSVLSVCGIVALAGVVVNDSIVLVDFINRRREEGGDLAEAVREAGVQRFRPILLTSLTTFAGLTPLLLERSVQAMFLIPMAVSLAFGVMFATVISLVLVPAGYLILDDLQRGFRAIYGKRS